MKPLSNVVNHLIPQYVGGQAKISRLAIPQEVEPYVSGPLSVVRRQKLKEQSLKGSPNLPLLTAYFLLPLARCIAPFFIALYLECNGLDIVQPRLRNSAPDRSLLCKAYEACDTSP